LGWASLIAGSSLIILHAVLRARRARGGSGEQVAVLFACAVTFIAPVYIEPLFNTYKPLTNPQIRDPILAMARANEIPVKQV
jgi:STE24 endopeptidase